MKKQLLVISAVIFAGIGYAGAAASGHEYGKDIEQTAWEGESFISLKAEAMNAGAPELDSAMEPAPVPVPVNPVQDAAIVLSDGMDRSVDRSKITEINAVYQGEYHSYLRILKLELKKAKEVLNDYLEKSLGCSNVRLCLTETIKPQGFWANFLNKNSKFKVSLTASCSGGFSNFRYEIYPAFDWDERSEVWIGYDNPQGPVVKKFTLRGIYEHEYKQAKDSDPSCW